MNKYSMVVDPIRLKNFAVIIETKTGLNFIPLNEMAKGWASSQSSLGTIHSVNAPDGMYISSSKNLTKSQQIMLEDSIKKNEEVKNPEYVYSGRHSTGKSSSGSSITGQQLRKIPRQLKIKVINYKAGSFKNRAKRSSVISAVKSHGLRLEAKNCTFRDSSPTKLEPVARSAGQSLSRRVAASYFIKDISGNRLSRRSKTLLAQGEELLNSASAKNPIEAAITSKASRFI